MRNSFFFLPGNGTAPAWFIACLCLFSLLSSPLALADTPLFQSHAVLELTIPLDFKTLCRPREMPDCDYTPTTLEYVDEHGEQQAIPIEVMIRGGWRALTKNCSAPLLFIRFDQSATADTPFQGQSVLPLTTHCGQGLSIEAARARQTRTTWEQYLLKEYLVHRLYNILTDVSLDARLVQMTYPNPENPDRRISNYAFFTEHFESVARRNGYELLERGSFDPQRLDLDAARLLALFQFMIGNTDWSIARERNITLLQTPEGFQVPLPYDFDMSGLVDAYYAGPAPSLPIDDVSERYYLGFCGSAAEMDALFTLFLAQQNTLVALTGTAPDLSRKSRKETRRFLNKFFDVLQSGDLRTEQIINRCQPWPPGDTDHTTPLD